MKTNFNKTQGLILVADDEETIRETIAELEAYLAAELGRPDGIDAAGNILPQPHKPRLDER